MKRVKIMIYGTDLVDPEAKGAITTWGVVK
jgi:hypothetical protein